MKEQRITRIWVEKGLLDSEPLLKDLKNNPDVEVFEDHPPLSSSRNTLIIKRFSGNTARMCPGMIEPYICCRLRTLDLMENCSMYCNYCFLHGYTGWGPVILNLNEERIKEEIISQKEEGLILRITTGEMSDSSILEGLIPINRWLSSLILDMEDVILEIKSKRAVVADVLESARRKIVMSWSVNPQRMIKRHEVGTSDIRSRLDAAERWVELGGRVAFHFDPIIYYPGWERDYIDLSKEILRRFRPEDIVWISLGTLRFSKDAYFRILSNNTKTGLIETYMTRAYDGKFRYPGPIRLKLLKTLYDFLMEEAGDLFVYLCMEDRKTWGIVTGGSPDSPVELDRMFTQRLRDTEI